MGFVFLLVSHIVVGCHSAVEIQQDGRRCGCFVEKERAVVHLSASVAFGWFKRYCSGKSLV